MKRMKMKRGKYEYTAEDEVSLASSRVSEHISH